MKPLEVVRIDRSESGSQLAYVENSIKSIVDRYPQFAHRKVCVLSVAGPFRKGKSFLLNFLLRYLRFHRDGKSGDWFDQNEPLQGFPSKSGTTSVTEGILVWPEPFLVKAGDEEVVLLLMDTQGSGDTKNRSSETTAVFALSTLVSSVTVFNVQTHLRLEDVNAVTFFSEYGRLASQENSPFQASCPFIPITPLFKKLIFVVRDWPDRTSFGQVDKNAFLSGKLSSAKGTAISEAFEELGCWHLPHPGNVVASGRFTGDTAEMKEDFRRHIKCLCEYLLSSAFLVAKMFGEKSVTLSELKGLFASYVSAMAKATLSDDESMLKAADNIIELSFSRFEEECTKKRTKELNSMVKNIVQCYWNLMNELINSSPQPLEEEIITQKLKDFFSAGALPSTLQLLEPHPFLARSLHFGLYKARCHFDAINNRRLRAARGGRILADAPLKDVLLCLDRDTLDGVQLVSRAHKGVVRLLVDVCLRVIIGASIDVVEDLWVRTTISIAKLDCTTGIVSTIGETGHGAAYLGRLTWLANALRNSTLHEARTVTVSGRRIHYISDQENTQAPYDLRTGYGMESTLWKAGGSGKPFVPAVLIKADGFGTVLSRYVSDASTKEERLDRIDLHILDVTIKDLCCDSLTLAFVTAHGQRNVSVHCSVYATDDFLLRCASGGDMHRLPKHPLRSSRDAIRNLLATSALTETGILTYCFERYTGEKEMRELRLTGFNVSDRFIYNFMEAARRCGHASVVAVQIYGDDPSYVRKSVEYAAVKYHLDYDRDRKEFSFVPKSLPTCYMDCSATGILTLLFYKYCKSAVDVHYLYETTESEDIYDCNWRVLKSIKNA